MVCFDSWYASVGNLKLVRGLGWHFLTRLKANRQVNPDREGLAAVSEIEIGEDGRVVRLKGFGLCKVFRNIATKVTLAEVRKYTARRRKLNSTSEGDEK